MIDFDSRVQVIQGFTNNVADLEGAIRKTNAGGSTSLHNAIYIALKELKRTQARGTDEIRRQAIVVLSDGEDTSSLVSFDEVLDLAKRSETAIYAIGLRGAHRPQRGLQRCGVRPAPAHAADRRPRVLHAADPELASVYGQIADELSSQYTLGYTSRNPKRDGAWRRIVVRAAAERVGTRQAGILRADIVGIRGSSDDRGIGNRGCAGIRGQAAIFARLTHSVYVP